jgi:hypothetical protein
MTQPTTIRLADDLTMPLDAATETFGIFGVKGRGKTFTAAVLTEQFLAAGVPVVVIDPTGVHWGLRSSADGKRPGFKITIAGGDHADVPLEETAGKLLAELVAAKRVPLLLDLSHFSKSAMRRFLTDFTETLYLKNRHPLHIIADECDLYAPQRAYAGVERLLGAMEDVVRRGRVRGLGISLISQRPASVNTNVRSQVSTLILLGLTGTHDIKAVDEWVNLHADPDTARTVKASLPALETGTAWVWSPQWLQILQQIHVNRRTTFDSSATPKVGETLIPPAEWATVDAAALSAEIAATVERGKADDPKVLKARIRELERELAKTQKPSVEKVPVPVDIVSDETKEQLLDATLRMAGIAAEVREIVRPLVELIEPVLANAERRTAAPPVPKAQKPEPAPPPAHTSVAASPDRVELRKGARRMVEALAAMAPLRLTKGQWGTVAKLKTSGGTWSTYMGDIRRAGLLDENDAGYTLTDAGFAYLGSERPAKMTGVDLQNHYRKILRAGAAKMLDALIDAHPIALTKEELGDAAEIVTTGGTFSTYLGDLTRNGLAERRDGRIVATDILIHGADL